MKIVLRILGGIGALVALLLLLVGACHLNPELSKKMGEVVSNVVPTQKQTNLEPNRTGSNTQNEIQVIKPTAADEGTDSREETAGLNNDILQPEYEAPALEDLRIDSLVSHLNGLEEIEDTGEVITKEEAQEIQDSLTVGKTGEGLDFDEEMYPYYAMLNDSAKELYRQIYANMEAMTQRFKPIHDTNAQELKNAFTAVCNDQPQLFFIKTGYGYKQDMTGNIVEIDLAYLFSEDEVDNARSRFDDEADEIIAMASGKNSDYDKEVVVHDALMDKITYDLGAPMNQSAYSALVNGRTVCAGYARAFQYICMKMDIPCYYCAGYAGENHAWNIIKLEDDYYNVDVTWDDTNPNTHNYFNCSDAEYAKDHVRRDLSVYLPPCNGEKYSDLILDPEPEKESEQPEEKEVKEEEKPAASDVKNDTTTPASTQSDTQTGNDRTTTTAEVAVSTGEQEKTVEEKVDLTKTAESVEEYFKICMANLKASDKDEMTFKIKVKDKLLWQDIRRTYQNEEYKDAYAQQMLKEKGKDYYSVDIEAERLTGGVYVLTHTVKIS